MWVGLMECRSSRELEGSTLLSKTGCGHVFIANWTHIVKVCFCPECKMEILIEHQYGMTSKPLEQESRNSPRMSISSSAGSLDLARISVLQDLEKDWQDSEARYVMTSLESLMKYDQNSSSWKMSQLLHAEEALKWSQKLPKWGMIVDGLLSQLLPWARYIKGNDGFSLPTPKASDSKRNDSPCERKRDNPDLTTKLNMIHNTKGKKVHPHFIEWMMTYPLGWTELKPWEMQWFLSKQKKRLKS